MLAAVTVYNSPLITFKSELFIVNSQIAWTYLFHAYYRRNHIRYFYEERQEKSHDVINGRKREWDLSRCIKERLSPIDEPTKNNLELLIQIRNKIEHSFYETDDLLISSYIQACSINFNYYIKKLFGDKYNLDTSLCLAIQFSPLNEDQNNLLLSKNTKDNVASLITAFSQSLPKDVQESPRYIYKVCFTKAIVNRPNQADQVINFKNADSEQLKTTDMAIKETEKRKYLPHEIIEEARRRGHSNFRIHEHMVLWKKENAKDPSKHFGVEICGKWYWYQNWVDFVLNYLKEQAIKHS